ncbi:MAG: class I SAM-dependent methyltransferase [Vicinamibacterales bacterium]
MTAPTDLRHRFGDLDIYLFDQLLRGRIEPGLRIFDAGCGGGRNLVYFLREGYDVRGIDPSPEAITTVRALASQLMPDRADDRFTVASLEAHSVPPASADVVIVSAVLHFARDDAHFDAMVEGAWRILAPGGLFFSRLASSIGIEGAVRPLGHGRFRLPDGSDRYLVDEPRLMGLTRQLDADLLDPLKTTVVQGQRAMTTWVLRRHGRRPSITVL